MPYKIFYSTRFNDSLNSIDEYCIEHFGNYDFGRELFQKIKSIEELLKVNPMMYPVSSKKIRKIVLDDYLIYYSIIQDSIVFMDIKNQRHNK